MATVVVIVGLVLVLGTLGWFVLARKHPENAAGLKPASHETDGHASASREFFGEVNDRPGSPGAEAQGVADRGQIVPGPSADTGAPDPSSRPPR
jgi:hypothetical protein